MTNFELIQLATKAAEEDAAKDLDFSRGLDRFTLSPEDKSKLRAALIQFAGTGAHRTVSLLKLHGVITTSK